jgi:excinuclease ABC subunit C
MPDLVLIDGGKPQVGAAKGVLDELGLHDLPLAGIAKEREELFLPDRPAPVVLPSTSQALYLVQRIRDEAHRFAITYHRELRGKRMTVSVLDGIPGLGEVRRKRLVKELGGVTAVKQATLEELQALAWLPDAVARAIHDKVHGGPRR